jgi:hypothetical protein
MAILRRSSIQKYKVSFKLETELDISRWSAILFGRNYVSQIFGSKIVIDHKIYFVPGLTRKEFITKCLYDFENKNIIECDYIETHGTHFSCCPSCNGNGIVDLVSEVVKRSIPKFKMGEDRIIDKTKILVYNRPKDLLRGGRTKNRLFLSVSKYDPSMTEKICSECLGTGLVLKAIYGFFLGYKELKKYLTEINILEEDAIEKIYKITQPDSNELDFDIC